MKKIVFLLTAVTLFLAGCNPMDEIYNDIEGEDIIGIGNEEYTLTEDDYADLELEFGSFDTEDQAKELIPGLLSDLYPYFENTSSVLVNYNLYVGQAEDVSDYTGAEDYELSMSDYAVTGSDANGFYPDANVEGGIATVLAVNYPNAEEGDIILAKYNQYREEPEVGYANFIEYNFMGSFEGWTPVDLVGPQGWTSQSNYIEGNGYAGGQVENLDWLVSPDIDLTNETDLRFQISQAINYAGDLSLLKIYITTNYTGDVTTTAWDEITLTNTPAGNSNDFILSEDYDFTAYEGEIVNIALKYESTNSDAARWRVENIFIKTVGVTGDSDARGMFFMYNGSVWEMAESTYYLSASDYDVMGAPGQYDNFSSALPADNYIPIFLKQKYPFAQENDQMIVVYKYYSSTAGETQIRGNLYTFSAGEWMSHQTVQEVSLQFVKENGVWEPDNTIKYMLLVADYATIAETLGDNPAYANAVSSMENYNNFDRRSGNPAYWSDEMIHNALAIVLENIDPNAEEGQKYLVTIDVYNGTNTTEDFKLIKEAGEWVPFLQE